MIVIHIGMPKTGSTTIQRFLRDNDAALRKLSIDYPIIGRENPNHDLNHRNFANELLGRKRRIHKKSSSISDLVSYMAEANFPKTILSSEELCRASQQEIARARELFFPLGQKFQVILIIRDLLELLPSAYAQSVRYGASTKDFDAFYETRSNNDNLVQANVAQRWAKVFGWSATHVRALSAPALRRGDLIDDFMATAGLDPEAPELMALPRPPRANESSGWKVLEAVRAYFDGASILDQDHPLIRMGKPDTPRKRKKFGAAADRVGREFGWHEDRGRYLTRAQAISCADSYASCVRRLNEHLGEKLPAPPALSERDHVERPFLPEASRIDPAELKAFYDILAARLEEQREARRLAKKAERTEPWPPVVSSAASLELTPRESAGISS